MRQRKTLSIALALSVALISLMSTATVNAQGGGAMEVVATTGMIDLAADEVLEISVFHKGTRQAVNVQFVESLWICACSFGGGPDVRIASETFPVVLEPDGAYRRRVTRSATTSVKGQSVDIMTDRPNKVTSISAQIYRIIRTPGSELTTKEYRGHVSLIKQ